MAYCEVCKKDDIDVHQDGVGRGRFLNVHGDEQKTCTGSGSPVKVA